MKTKSIMTSALIICGFAVAAVAQAGDAPMSRTVAFRDLNLNSDSDAQVLFGRLEKAARSVCGDVEFRDLSALSKWQDCVNHAVAAAVTQVDRSTVTAIYNQKFKATEPTRLVAAR